MLIHIKNFFISHLLLSISWGSSPGRETVTPVGATATLTCFTVRLHIRALTKSLWIAFPTTDIGGCRTFGKKLKVI